MGRQTAATRSTKCHCPFPCLLLLLLMAAATFTGDEDVRGHVFESRGELNPLCSHHGLLLWCLKTPGDCPFFMSGA